MSFLENMRLAWESIRSNRLRSFLTMLGIIIGISAVITITTIGSSLQKTISLTMNQLGNTKIIYAYVNAVMPEFQTDAEWEMWEWPEPEEEEEITYEKLVQFQEDFEGKVENVLLESYVGDAISRNEDKEYHVTVKGVTPGYFDCNRLEIIAGRDISKEDNLEKKSTVVVSDLYVQQVFDGENPLGKVVEFEFGEDQTLHKFLVVGIYHFDRTKEYIDPKVRVEDITTQVFIPQIYVREEQKANGTMYSDNYFSVTCAEGCVPAEIAEEMKTYFDEKYFSQRGRFYLEAYDMESELKMIDNVLTVLTVAISVIAAISLIVGGVGVMNIMLVSVVERTREIGIRKAMGAKNKSIRRQFLTEAVVICLFGGVIGILSGIINGIVLSQVAAVIVKNMEQGLSDMLSVTVSPSITAIVISVVFSMLTGMIFGYYPAKRAANMSPIDALRYE